MWRKQHHSCRHHHHLRPSRRARLTVSYVAEHACATRVGQDRSVANLISCPRRHLLPKSALLLPRRRKTLWPTQRGASLSLDRLQEPTTGELTRMNSLEWPVLVSLGLWPAIANAHICNELMMCQQSWSTYVLLHCTLSARGRLHARPTQHEP
jgi:hypothetical protein